MLTSQVKTLAWGDVVRFYDGLAKEHQWRVEPMAELVRFIAESPYAKALFPATSHATLLVGRVADFERGDNMLQVNFLFEQQSFVFTYVQSPAEPESWSLECSANEGRAVFERLLHKRLRWFHEG
jgi:hypothetical protein